MKEQGSRDSSTGFKPVPPDQGPVEECGNCCHWEYVEEDFDEQIGMGDCMCLISPHFNMLMSADETCDFWKGIDE
jgi:hypothetical protein